MDKYEQKNKVNNQQSAQVCAKISIPKASFLKDVGSSSSAQDTIFSLLPFFIILNSFFIILAEANI